MVVKEIRHRNVKQYKTQPANVTFVGMLDKDEKKEKHSLECMTQEEQCEHVTL